MENEKQVAGNDDGYYFDRVHINSTLAIDKLKTVLPLDDLKKECRYLSLCRSDPKFWPYKTRIEVVAPTKKFLDLLVEIDSITDVKNIITYIEIAHDVFYPSRHEAEYAAYDLFKVIRKKNSRGYIYRRNTAKESIKKWRKDFVMRGLFAKATFYSVYENIKAGTRKSWFKLVVYARLSKINWRPCIHFEWRIKKAKHVSKRTGIKTIRDLLAFDCAAYCQKMEKKYILHEALDHNRIGKVLAGLERKQNLTMRQSISAGLALAHFCACYKIVTLSDFAMVVKNEYEHSEKTRGPKTLWAEKIRRLKNFSSYSHAV